MITDTSAGGVDKADPEAAHLERYGITRVRADTYHVGGFRYGNIADAIAQAKRAERDGGSGK